MNESSSLRAIAFLASLLFASGAFAEEPPPLPGGPTGGHEDSKSTDSDTDGRADEEPDVSDQDDREKRDNSRFTIGFGPGFVYFPPNPGAVGGDFVPAFALQTRKTFLAGGVIGFEWTNDIVFHDFEAMGDAYRWYFESDGDDLQALKLGALWPGLILIPFGGANYATGFGLIAYTSPRIPSLFFDIGANLNLFLRLSDPQFKADFAIGAYGGLGFDFSQHVGFGARVNWGTPLIHNLVNNTTGSIFQVLATLNISF